MSSRKIKENVHNYFRLTMNTSEEEKKRPRAKQPRQEPNLDLHVPLIIPHPNPGEPYPVHNPQAARGGDKILSPGGPAPSRTSVCSSTDHSARSNSDGIPLGFFSGCGAGTPLLLYLSCPWARAGVTPCLFPAPSGLPSITGFKGIP